MTTSFDNIPSNIRVPWTYIEFNNENAIQGSQKQPYKVLIFGQKLSDAEAEAEKLVLVTNQDKAKTLFGEGSVLHKMAETYFKNNKFTPTYFMPLDEPESGGKAAGAIAVAIDSLEDGTANLYIGGERVSIGISSEDTADDIAAAIASAINAKTSLPVTAEATTNIVAVNCKWKGQLGNEIDIRLNYYEGENMPKGLSLTITEMSGGSGNPNLSSALAKLGDNQFNIIAMPYTNGAALSLLQSKLEELNGPLIQKDGYAFMAKDGTVASLSTYGLDKNTQFFSTLGIKGSPTPSYQIAAALAGVASYYGNIDPARPFQTLKLAGVLAPNEEDRFTLLEKNILLYDGISTSFVDSSGNVCIERLITMYRENAMGADDPSYLDITTLLTLSYLRYSFRNRILTKYPRHKLANDGTRYGQGQAIVTPSVIKAEAIAIFGDWEKDGLVENLENFKEALIVERDESDVNRLNISLPPDLINQLMVTAAKIKFLL
jgi:phage tail sheath gpL-like